MRNLARLLWGAVSESDRFIKFIPSEEAMYLLKQKGHAFRLLTIVAESARRYEGAPDGLNIGECFIGGHEKYDMTEQNYRTAKALLVSRNHIEIIETCRTRKKGLTSRDNFNSPFCKNPTTGVTTVGTKVKLLSSNVYDINSNNGNDRTNDWVTTDQRPTNDKLRRIKKDKKDHPSIPSVNSDELKTDDFSFENEKIEIIPGVWLAQVEIDACLQVKGNLEEVKKAIEYIQNSKRRKHPISDWPNALSKWKIENKSQNTIQEHILYTEKLYKEFEEYEQGNGWRCRMYNDNKKDQRGILFEYQTPYQESFFVSLLEGELKIKCDDFIKRKNMRIKK